ncbi:39S ribosomal protein L45, mitochondrial [Gaertneriomyces sp. JEL0708]|nr:39S ribosomal protein L45, mitochondrial [Gaertneriomyces sp. JEL0708]
MSQRILTPLLYRPLFASQNVSRIFPARTLLLSTPPFVPIREMSSASRPTQQSLRGRPLHLNIIDPKIPLPSSVRPAAWTKEGKAYWKERATAFVRSLLAVYQLRKAPGGFKTKDFKEEAQQLYIEMNKAFARCDRLALSELVTDTFLGQLNTSLKGLSRHTQVWKPYPSPPPKVVTIVSAKVQTDATGEGLRIVQATVRIPMRQSLALYDSKGKLVAGSEEEIKELVEYVVFEKWLDEGPMSGGPNWKVAGKVKPSWEEKV